MRSHPYRPATGQFAEAMLLKERSLPSSAWFRSRPCLRLEIAVSNRVHGDSERCIRCADLSITSRDAHALQRCFIVRSEPAGQVVRSHLAGI